MLNFFTTSFTCKKWQGRGFGWAWFPHVLFCLLGSIDVPLGIVPVLKNGTSYYWMIPATVMPTTLSTNLIGRDKKCKQLTGLSRQAVLSRAVLYEILQPRAESRDDHVTDTHFVCSKEVCLARTRHVAHTTLDLPVPEGERELFPLLCELTVWSQN